MSRMAAVIAAFCVGGMGGGCTPLSSDRLSDLDLGDLAGTWRLENASTWNVIEVDARGTVVGGDHPHGVESISGELGVAAEGRISGWYEVVDAESLSNTPPQPQGTWYVTLSGRPADNVDTLRLDYTLEYRAGGETESYAGTWTASRE